MQRAGMRAVYCFVSAILVAACAARPPIVADPPEHVRAPSEQFPWEEQYERAMIKPGEVSQPVPDPHQDQKFNGQLETTEDRGTLGLVADAIAFPFRAIGWLFQAMF
jgi:hypothetical protein